MSIAEQRATAVRETVDRIRAIAGTVPVDRDRLARMRDELVALAARKELFPRADFPATGDEEEDTYVLSSDADGRNTLYLYSSAGEGETPLHDHSTWAVIAGIEGAEHNRIYRRLDDGSVPGRGAIELVREVTVGPHDGLALAAEDVHSIHCDTAVPMMHLHMYGMAFENITDRVQFDMTNGTTAPYGAPDVVEGTGGC